MICCFIDWLILLIKEVNDILPIDWLIYVIADKGVNGMLDIDWSKLNLRLLINGYFCLYGFGKTSRNNCYLPAWGL